MLARRFTLTLAGLFVALSAMASTASAIVIRDDVADVSYKIDASEMLALADIPSEGHGVLIAPQWVVTAAHAVTWQSHVPEVSINGIARRVERVIIHPGYRQVPQELIAQAVETGDPTQIMAFLATSDDIALLRLSQPVTDVNPAILHREGAELGRVATIIGRGATGGGTSGHDPHGPNRTQLRRAFNEVTSADGRWLNYVFDRPPSALPLEGMSGNGDSGGPVLIKSNGRWELAGLTSWKYSDEAGAMQHPSSYGQTSYNVRLSHYVEWIEGVITAD